MGMDLLYHLLRIKGNCVNNTKTQHPDRSLDSPAAETGMAVADTYFDRNYFA